MIEVSSKITIQACARCPKCSRILEVKHQVHEHEARFINVTDHIPRLVNKLKADVTAEMKKRNWDNVCGRCKDL